MNSFYSKFFGMLLLLFPFAGGAQINVHSSKKYLVETKTGKPFFWLGDTGWELFHRLKREDVINYLDKRKAQGFNVIQAVALAENNGIAEPNRYGDLPFEGTNPDKWAVTSGADFNDPTQYDYWDNVDFAITEAAKRKLYIGLLPTWGDKVAHHWGEGPMVFNEQNAYTYTKKLAMRYKHQWNIIWILGGDRPGFYEKDGKKYDDRPVWRAMAKAIEEVCGAKAFITYHPGGSPDGSSAWFHTDTWLDMNAIQSGHGSKEYPIWNYIKHDLSLKPLKPTMDMEPCYEDHPVNPWDGKWTRQERGFFNDYDVRVRMYRGVFAGGCGSTYGHHSVWQFLDTALYPPVYVGDTVIPWKQALEAKAAYQMRYLKELMLSHADANRIEDSLLITSARGKDYRDLVIATRNVAATYAMVYLPQPLPVTINMDILKGGKKAARWFNPATGRYTVAASNLSSGIITFTPPGNQQKDLVLVIDAKSR